MMPSYSRLSSASFIIAFAIGCSVCENSAAQTKFQLEGLYADIAAEIESLNCDTDMEAACVIIHQRFDSLPDSQQEEEKELQKRRLRLLFLLLWKKLFALEAEFNKTDMPEFPKFPNFDLSQRSPSKDSNHASSQEKNTLDVPFRSGMSPDGLPDGPFKTNYKNYLEAESECHRLRGIKNDLTSIQDLFKKILLSEESIKLAHENIEDEEFNNYLAELYEKKHAAKLNKQ